MSARHTLSALVPGLALLAAMAVPARAAPVVLLNDTFNTENGGNGRGVWNSFANFTAADIDLLGPGFFGNLCVAAGHSNSCVDMEGNGNGSLTSRTAYDLAPGQATLQFDLAGDQRTGSGSNVTVSLVSTLADILFSETFALPSNAPFQTFTRTVNIAAPVSARLRFLSGGPADSYGMLLDNVILTADGSIDPGPGPSPSPVPEPASLVLLGAGLAGLASTRRGAARK
jgi:hypothetical protein